MCVCLRDRRRENIAAVIREDLRNNSLVRCGEESNGRERRTERRGEERRRKLGEDRKG